MEKIAIFSHNFPPAIDGGSHLFFQIAEDLQKQGLKVRVFTSDASSTDHYLKPKAKRLKTGWQKQKELSVFRLKTWRWGKYPLKILRNIFRSEETNQFFSLLRSGPLFSLSSFFKIIFYLRKWQPDCLMTGVFPTTLPLYSWLISKLLKTKLIVVPCFHEKDSDFYRFPLVDILRQSEKIFVLTQTEKKTISKLGISESKIALVNPQVEESFLLGPQKRGRFNEPPTILFLGSQAAHKKITLLIRVFAKLAKKYQDWQLIIAGPKTFFSPKIEKLVFGLQGGIQKRIKLLGKVSEKKKKELLDKTWILVNPSINESFGFVFLEAWARKKPVIGSNLGTLKEVILPGENGFLYSRNSHKDLTEKIESLITNKKLAIKMGEKGYKIMKEGLSKKMIVDLNQ